jgi:7-carboxy-7-deazaguanine synthase
MPDIDTEATRRTEKLRITEIFHSLQGESLPVGCPTVFIRLTGCPLRCTYCDTEYAFHGGRQTALAEILEQTAIYRCRFVCVTGGEPLAQPNCLVLLTALCDLDYEVSLETSGALDISSVDPRVSIVMDLKTPASGESDRNRWENLTELKPTDQLKFVVSNREDYDWAKAVVAERGLIDRLPILFSPAWGQEIERELAEWILADRLAVRFQIQLHKVLWGETPGH